MEFQNSYHELGEYAHNLIRSKARKLIGKAGLTFSDREDIEQELALDLLRRLKNFDPSKSKRTSFMALVVENRSVSLLEERHAACRDWRCCLESLDDLEVRGDEDDCSRLDSIPDPSTPTREDLAAKVDFQTAYESLSGELRELCEQLLDSNLNAVSRKTGTPRTTLYSHREKLRKALRGAGV